MPFEQFKEAQEREFPRAIAELRAGRKHSHWIWFVFPQLKGLGSSSMSLRFALPDARAAREYLADPVLRARFNEAVDVVHDQVCARGASVEELMGSDIDALKLVSSLTLFVAVAARDAEFRALGAQAADILDAAEAQGYARCAFTEKALRLSPP